MYHISDLKKFLRCNRYYYLSLGDDRTYRPYFRNDESMTTLFSKYFDIEEYFEGSIGDKTDCFFEKVDKYEWFFKSRFEINDLRINVPIMHKVNGNFDVYFFSNRLNAGEFDSVNYRTIVEVLTVCGINVDRVFVIYLNKDYVFHNSLNPKELFLLTDELNNKKIIDLVNEDYFDYQAIINEMKNNSLDTCPSCKNKNCKGRSVCDYYYDCFKNEKNLEKDSILTLVSSKEKSEMFDSGIRLLKDVDLSKFDCNKVQYAQIMASKNGGLYVEKYNLLEYLKKLDKRPISFVDFEWDHYLIPEYEGMKPYDYMCFEFALYILDEDNHLVQKTFVGNKDCRKDFVEGLIEALPKEGPIIAYNAIGAECLRLKELAEVFPQYREDLEGINERFVDLAYPFIEGMIYDISMEGNFSIKKLVPICSDFSYENLDIYDGMEAVYNWRDFDKGISDDGQKIVDDLKEYCSLDAYALFLIYKYLVKVALTNAKEDF